MGCWKFLCISSLAQPRFSSGVSGSKFARSLRFRAASLARHPWRLAERQQHVDCPLHACDVGSMRCSHKLKIAIGNVMLDDNAAKTLLQINFFATDQRAQDGCTHTDTHPRTETQTHTPRLSRLSIILLAPRRVFVGRPPAVLASAAGLLVKAEIAVLLWQCPRAASWLLL